MKIMLLFISIIVTTFSLKAQEERSLWEVNAGLRLNYLGLNGYIAGYDAAKDHEFNIDYKKIGMDNYSPSLALSVSAKYKKWNLLFASSSGYYDGGFITNIDIIKEGTTIDSGSVVDGLIDIDIYTLNTTYNIIQKKHDLGVGIGFIFMDMKSGFTTTDVDDEVVTTEGDYFFPMPFLAASGRLNFDKFKISGSGGAAYFNGSKDGMDYKVFYYTIDVRGTYYFYEHDNWSSSLSAGYRTIYMDMNLSDERGWYTEHDIYSGPYLSLRVKFSSTETYINK